MPVYRHLISFASLLYGLANLTFWCMPLFLLTVTRLLFPATGPSIRRATDAIYRAAVRCNDFWFRRVLGYQWQPTVPGLDPATTCLVISNHQSWADSFLIQAAIVHNGPVLKVLVKQQLMWIPPLAMIFWAYDFPRLKRRARRPQDEADRKRVDAERVLAACKMLKDAPSAMLLYPEGTRFTEEKRGAAAPYQRLLPPKPGGFALLLDGLDNGPRLPIVDLSIVYPDTPDFWSFLSGGVREPRLFSQVTHADDITDPAAWLRARWEAKDRLLTASSTRPSYSAASGRPFRGGAVHTNKR